MDSGGVMFERRLDLPARPRNIMIISPKTFGYGAGAQAAPAPAPAMVSLASCPKCRHVFPLAGGACPAPPCAPPAPPPPPPDLDLLRIARAQCRLRQSGWYYEDLTWQASSKVLARSEPGTFLVRDSGAHNYLFSLSVQTARGPTSVRLQYARGLFRLDALPGAADLMPQFDCVVRLVEHYAEATRRLMWVDPAGARHSSVELRRPLLRAPAPLAHLARLAVHRAVRAAAAPSLPLLPPSRCLGLPACLQDYLQDYPYTC